MEKLTNVAIKFIIFDPVFNVADTAISTGVGLLIVFNKSIFPKKKPDASEIIAEEHDLN